MAAESLAKEVAQEKPLAPAPRKGPVIYWADLIRVLAIYLVVVIHVSGQLTNVWGKIPESQWIMADIIGGLARVGVPLFFMLSGFLLLPRSESLRDFYGKRMLRIVIPFVFWSIFYISLDCIGKPGLCTRDYLLPYALLQRSYFHLWFLYSLIGIYFILPLLRLMVRPGTESKFLWYLIVLWLIFQPIRTLMDQFLHFSLNINAPLATGFLPYFILGYLLGDIALTRGRLIVAEAAFVIGSLITILGTYLLTRAAGKFNGYFYDYVTLGTILGTAGAFLLLRAVSDVGFMATDRFRSLMRWVAGGTFGVYLIHVLVIWGLDSIRVNSFMGFALWSVLLVATLVFVISFLIVRLLQKIPIMNYILPG
jgi:surface polysaccharide O-acyltransferase-like enzyme